MKTLLRLLLGFPSRPKRTVTPKRKKKLSAVLADRLMSLPLAALKAKWDEDLWKPGS